MLTETFSMYCRIVCIYAAAVIRKQAKLEGLKIHACILSKADLSAFMRVDPGTKNTYIYS